MFFFLHSLILCVSEKITDMFQQIPLMGERLSETNNHLTIQEQEYRYHIPRAACFAG